MWCTGFYKKLESIQQYSAMTNMKTVQTQLHKSKRYFWHFFKEVV